MKVFYDTEFHEDGKTIELISIGLVRADGTSFYGISSGFNWVRAASNPWLAENVLVHLPRARVHVTAFHSEEILDIHHRDVYTPWDLADKVGNFIRETPDPSLWAYYGAYDHVALAQLWGPMINLPKWVPIWTNDIKQTMREMGVTSDLMKCIGMLKGVVSVKPRDANIEAEYVERRVSERVVEQLRTLISNLNVALVEAMKRPGEIKAPTLATQKIVTEPLTDYPLHPSVIDACETREKEAMLDRKRHARKVVK